MSAKVINLTSLAEARAKMTPGEWTPSAHPKRWADLPAPQAEVEANRENDAAGIVAEHNAVPVLLEVAAAAGVALDHLRALSAENVTRDSGSSRYVVAMVPEHEVLDIIAALEAALAKVTL